MPLAPPPRLGLPKFPTWRDSQPEAIREIINAYDDYNYAVLPDQAGFGKTAVEMGVAECMRRGGEVERAVILTATRGLQDQMGRDGPHLEDLKGKANYKCAMPGARGYLSCEHGPDRGCHLESQCTHAIRKATCSRASTVITNYACKIAMSMYPNATGIGEFGLTICDEAHQIPDEITRALSTTLTADDQREILNATGHGEPAKFEGWGGVCGEFLKWYADEFVQEDRDIAPEEVRVLRDKASSFARNSGKDNWITYHKEGRGKVDHNLYLDIIWPGMRTKQLLFPTGLVLFTSATMTKRTLSQNGIAKNDVYWRKGALRFDPARWPMTWVKCARMRGDIEKNPDRHKVIKLIDETIRTRAVQLKRNGIIHAVSYKFARWIKENSMYGNRIILPDSKTTRKDVETFKGRPGEGIVLCSPAVDTGYDFPNDECRWVFLPKVPYTFVGDPLTKARNSVDPRYSNDQIAMDLAQMVSRGMRGRKDWCEIICSDDMIWVWCNQNRDLLVDWFPLYEGGAGSGGRMRVSDSGLPVPMKEAV